MGPWVNNQRMAQRAGKLSERRIAALEAAGFVFDPHQTTWDEGFAHFKRIKPNARVRTLKPAGPEAKCIA